MAEDYQFDNEDVIFKKEDISWYTMYGADNVIHTFYAKEIDFTLSTKEQGS